jgi:hypothetical protein
MHRQEYFGPFRLFVYTILAVGSLVTVGAWTGGLRRENSQGQSRIGVTVENKTTSLLVTKAEIESSGRSVRLAIRNATNKNIDWFRISFGAGLSIETDFTFADKAILAPEESYEDTYPISTDSGKLEVTIVSVVFEDKTVDGDVASARWLMDKRSGQKMELARLLPLLNQTINARDKDQASLSLLDLESEISQPEDRSDLLPEAKRIGVRTARERVLNDIREVKILGEKQGRDVRQDLRDVKARYNRISTRMEKYSL